jgi:hypothetical protein
MRLLKSSYIIFSLFLLILSPQLFADAYSPKGSWLFGSAALGYTRITSGVSNTPASSATGIDEVTKSGFDLNGKGAFSYYSNNWVNDLGLGYAWSRFSYSNKDPNTSGSAASKPTMNHTMTIKNLFFDYSPRYKLTHSLQLGPYFQWHRGSDVGHSEVANNNVSQILYYGAHLNYDMPLNSDWLMRLGFQAITDFNEKKRRTLQLNGVIEIGYQLFGGSSSHASRKEEVEDNPPPQEEAQDQYFADEQPVAA